MKQNFEFCKSWKILKFWKIHCHKKKSTLVSKNIKMFLIKNKFSHIKNKHVLNIFKTFVIFL